MFLLLAFATLGTAFFFVSEAVTAPSRERRKLVTRAAEYGKMRISHGRELPRFRERVLSPFIGRAAAVMLRVNPRTSIESVSAKLAAAGMRGTSPTSFLAARAGFGLGGVVLGLVLGSSASPIGAFFFAFTGAAAGF